VLIFVVALALSRGSDCVADLIEIPNHVAIQFFSALAQALAALLAFLTAFVVFTMQAIDQERHRAYRHFQSATSRLGDLILQHPEDLEVLGDELDVITGYLHSSMDDLVLDPSQVSYWADHAVPLLDKCRQLYYHEQPWELKWHCRRILSTLQRAEHALDRLNYQAVGAITVRLEIEAIAKLSFLLGMSLLLVLAFGTIDRQDVFPDMDLPIILASLAWLMLTLIELALQVRQRYVDFKWESGVSGED